MSIDRKRYPDNWDEIALKVKRKSKWTCQRCGLKCLKPRNDRSKFTKSEKAKLTLTVHHKNYRPEDNSEENLRTQEKITFTVLLILRLYFIVPFSMKLRFF